MTDNKLDLDSIPHPRDCHRVPAGATIPKGTLVWGIRPHDGLPHPWVASRDITQTSNAVNLTAEPIPAPVPRLVSEDSPIIASGVDIKGTPFTDDLLVVDPDDGTWFVSSVGQWVDTQEITKWHPAIVTATGHGVMDERDKRDRMLPHGERIQWIDPMEAWGLPGGECYGTLAAIAADWTEELRFADEVQS